MSGSSIYKIILIGDTGVGKSTFLAYAGLGLGLPAYDAKEIMVSTPTVGVDFRSITIREPMPMRLHVWDTAGQEAFRSIVPYYFRAAAVALVFFDMYDEQTLRNIPGWLDTLLDEEDKMPTILLVGNKSLSPHRGCDDILRSRVKEELIATMAQRYKADYVVISVKENPSDAQLVISKVAEIICEHEPAPTPVRSDTLLECEVKTKTCCRIL